MDSTRQNKISRLIQKELSDILLKLAKETRGIMVSVSIVRVSPDLGIAKAYTTVSDRTDKPKFDKKESP